MVAVAVLVEPIHECVFHVLCFDGVLMACANSLLRPRIEENE